MRVNRCSYCGTTGYGKGCRFAPQGIHFHPDDSTKCSYCGSADYGKGCRLNPTSNLHVHGGAYNSMYKEEVQSFLDQQMLIHLLCKPFSEYQCYKLGVIDEKGNKIKSKLNEQEQQSFDTFTQTIVRIKKYLGPKVDLIQAINNANSYKMVTEDCNINYLNKLNDYKNQINDNINELYKIVEQAQMDGLELNEIKNLIKAWII